MCQLFMLSLGGVVGVLLLKDEKKQERGYGNLKTTRGVDLKVSRHVVLRYHSGYFQAAQMIK